MAKNHMKRIAAPRSWNIDRKEKTFIMRQDPGPHTLQESIPLSVFIRTIAKEAHTAKEVRAILTAKQVLVDGTVRREQRLPVGLFDVISFPLIKRHMRVVYDKQGRLTGVDIPEAEANKKIVYIAAKHVLPKKRIQLNLSDGRNIITDKTTYKVDDSLLIELPSQKILKYIPIEKGTNVFLITGAHKARQGTVISTDAQMVKLTIDGNEIETKKTYALATGAGKSEITIA